MKLIPIALHFMGATTFSIVEQHSLMGMVVVQTSTCTNRNNQQELAASLEGV